LVASLASLGPVLFAPLALAVLEVARRVAPGGGDLVVPLWQWEQANGQGAERGQEAPPARLKMRGAKDLGECIKLIRAHEVSCATTVRIR
jgi:hypothetical protein